MHTELLFAPRQAGNFLHCAFLRVACTWILQDARTSLWLEVKPQELLCRRIFELVDTKETQEFGAKIQLLRKPRQMNETREGREGKTNEDRQRMTNNNDRLRMTFEMTLNLIWPRRNLIRVLIKQCHERGVSLIKCFDRAKTTITQEPLCANILACEDQYQDGTHHGQIYIFPAPALTVRSIKRQHVYMYYKFLILDNLNSKAQFSRQWTFYEPIMKCTPVRSDDIGSYHSNGLRNDWNRRWQPFERPKKKWWMYVCLMKLQIL